jgi:hypothetical protein
MSAEATSSSASLPRRRGRLIAGCVVAAALAAAAAVAVLAGQDSGSPHSTLAGLAGRTSGCPTAHGAVRSRTAVLRAQARWRLESEGVVIHRDLRRIAHDPVLVEALSAHDLAGALAEANRQLVRHVVRIRVLRGSRVLVDANPTSFDVGGSAITIHGSRGAVLGRLQITVQDIIGFNKLVHRLMHAAAVVRGAAGQARNTLPAAASLTLPSSGCVRVGRRTYVVGSFRRLSFTGEPLSIWILTAA